MPTYLVWNKNQSHCSSAYARQTTQNNTNGWQTWSPTTTGWNYVGIRTKTHSNGQTWSPTANHWAYVGIRAKTNNQITKQTNQQINKKAPGVVSHDHLPTYLVWNEDQGDVVPLKGTKLLTRNRGKTHN